MRLERFVSQSIAQSRRAVRELVNAGRVTVNGVAVREPGRQVVQHEDDVRLDGNKLEGPGGHRLLMMNKPAGCITATKSAEHETVMEHVPTDLWHRNLFPIGRLDKDTTGLLLFATDGAISQMLLHPRRHVEKAYIVTLKDPMPDGAEALFAAGVELKDGSVCLPAKLERIDELNVRVIVTEGRYHQVKRMIGHTGGFVTHLHRERIGALLLDPELPIGKCRPLTADERKQLVDSVRSRADSRAKTRPTPLVRGRRRRKKRGTKR